MGMRVMGKASFAHLQDMSGRIQLYVQRETIARRCTASSNNGPRRYRRCEGVLFKTKTASCR